MKWFIVVLTVMSSGILLAQNEEDALRYSMTYFGGSARNLGTAGAMTALGGDFSLVTHNPAGLGRLTKSQFSFTPNLEVNKANASFYGTSTDASRTSFNLGNVSYVKAYELNPKKFNNWYSVQIGTGMNRIKSFNQEIHYAGSVDSSILHSFIRDAEGVPEAYIYGDLPFTAGLAYDVYALDPGATDGEYVTQFQNGKAQHSRDITRKGGMTEFNVLTVSGNYGNKLLLGASVNLLMINYLETFTHVEDYDDSTNWLNGITYTGRLDIKGRGLNLRAGAIYMPTEQVRIGFGIETPSAYWMKDSWTNNMRARTDAGEKFVETENVPQGNYNYRVRTPFKANLSAAGVLPKFGSIGVEVEYVDYGDARLKSKKNTSAPYSFAAENEQIDNIYRPTFNYRIGLEARINPRIYARGGFAYYGTPYKEKSGNNLEPTMFITGGLGYNFGILYMDLAYVLKGNNADYYAYDPTMNGSHSRFQVRNSQVALTVGARF